MVNILPSVRRPSAYVRLVHAHHSTGSRVLAVEVNRVTAINRRRSAIEVLSVALNPKDLTDNDRAIQSENSHPPIIKFFVIII